MKKLNNGTAILIVMATLGMTSMLAACSDTKTKESASETTTVTVVSESVPIIEESEAADETTSETAAGTDEWEAPGSKYITVLKSFEFNRYNNPYLNYYGEPVLVTTRKDIVDHVDDYIVTSEKYDGTDFYDLAVKYEDEGYLLTDIPSEYSFYGGYFFSEGFSAKTWGESEGLDHDSLQIMKARKDQSIEVIRTDAATLEEYLKHYYVTYSDYVVESFDKEEADGKITYSMRIKRIVLQSEAEFDIKATLDTATEIAVVEKIYQ